MRHKVYPNQVSAWKQRAVERLSEVLSKGAERSWGEIRDLHAKIGGADGGAGFRRKGSSGEPGANPAAFRQDDQGGIRLNGSSFGTPSGHTKAGFGFANSVNSRTPAGRLSM